MFRQSTARIVAVDKVRSGCILHRRSVCVCVWACSLLIAPIAAFNSISMEFHFIYAAAVQLKVAFARRKFARAKEIGHHKDLNTSIHYHSGSLAIQHSSELAGLAFLKCCCCGKSTNLIDTRMKKVPYGFAALINQIYPLFNFLYLANEAYFRFSIHIYNTVFFLLST